MFYDLLGKKTHTGGGCERQETKDGPRQARKVLHWATYGFLFYADLLGFFFAMVVNMLQFFIFPIVPAISLRSL